MKKLGRKAHTQPGCIVLLNNRLNIVKIAWKLVADDCFAS